MRVLVLIAIAACHGAPTCKEAITSAMTRITAGTHDTALLIGTCEQDNWSADARRCAASAPTRDELDACPRTPRPAPEPTALEPAAATRSLVAGFHEPIRVLLFLPDGPVKLAVETYFAALATTGKLAIESHDRYVEARLATQYKVAYDGTIVLVRGDRSATLRVDLDLDRAEHGTLRHFDRDARRELERLGRDPRKAYLVAGHGEATDPDSQPPEKKPSLPERRLSMFKRRLEDLGYQTPPLHLATDVPADATVVILLAPITALQPTEWDVLARYLDRGGKLLLALDPTTEPSLGPLETKLGVHFDPGHLIDDKTFLPQRGTPADHRLVVTTQFSAHASVTGLSRATSKGLVLIDAGTLRDVAAATPVTKTFTIRSLETSFVDTNDNFAFDAATEQRQHWNIAAAIEGPKLGTKPGFRATVFADVDLFTDVLVQSTGRPNVIMISGPLLDDTLRWLAGEETFTGQTVDDDTK